MVDLWMQHRIWAAPPPVEVMAAQRGTVVAVDDTIHVMMRHRQLATQMNGVSLVNAKELGFAGEASQEWAIRETINQVGPALAITTAILVSGFAAMLISPMPGIRMFSFLGCIILFIAFVGDLLILPAMLFVFNRHVVSVRDQT